MDVGYPPLWLLTGLKKEGKTTFCRSLAEKGLALDWDVAGLISPVKLGAGEVKIGILAEDLRSGDQRTLAYNTPAPYATLQYGPWYFDETVIRWANEVIQQSTPCDLLIVDELGPLEFKLGKGMTSAFMTISAGRYRAGCVVVRESLLAQARERWPWSEICRVEQASIEKILSTN